MPSIPTFTKILLIEDDADTRANLRDILEFDDIQVEAASSIADALQQNIWDEIRVVVLDRKLPEGNAEDLLAQIKQRAPHAAVVIVTAYADLDAAISAMREGADDYLLKPVNPELLRRTLQRQLQRLRLEEEKQRSDASFRDLVEAAGCMIIILDANRALQYFNPFAEELTGYRAQEVIGRDYFELFVPAAERQAVTEVFQRVLSGELLRNFQSVVLRKDGSRAHLLWNSRRLEHYADQPVVLGVAQDITSLKDAQDKALQSERLAAIGQMVAGLAHESRNALQRSQACLEMLEFEISDKPEACDLVRRIQKAQDQLHKLFDEVRGYVSPLQLDRCECQLSEIWREAWELLTGQRRGRRAELRESLCDLDLLCQVDRFRLVQVFRNLLENSLAACSDPVEIEIVCTRAQLNGREAIRVAVRDNGPGLNAAQRERIFEPFFTTKTQGTGLGMAIAQRIIEAHGGRIAVGDGWDRGAEMLLFLPRNSP